MHQFFLGTSRWPWWGCSSRGESRLSRSSSATNSTPGIGWKRSIEERKSKIKKPEFEHDDLLGVEVRIEHLHLVDRVDELRIERGVVLREWGPVLCCYLKITKNHLNQENVKWIKLLYIFQFTRNFRNRTSTIFKFVFFHFWNIVGSIPTSK